MPTTSLSPATAQQVAEASQEKAAKQTPLSKSQTITVQSSEAEIARRPSELSATPLTGPVCPVSVRCSCPSSTSQTFNVPSLDAEIARRPSALSATPMTGLL